MSKPKLTPWFNWDVRPTRKGTYEVSIGTGETAWRLWTGREWLAFRGSPECARVERIVGLQPCEWRGLAEPPKGGKKE